MKDAKSTNQMHPMVSMQLCHRNTDFSTPFLKKLGIRQPTNSSNAFCSALDIKFFPCLSSPVVQTLKKGEV